MNKDVSSSLPLPSVTVQQTDVKKVEGVVIKPHQQMPKPQEILHTPSQGTLSQHSRVTKALSGIAFFKLPKMFAKNSSAEVVAPPFHVALEIPLSGVGEEGLNQLIVLAGDLKDRILTASSKKNFDPDLLKLMKKDLLLLKQHIDQFNCQGDQSLIGAKKRIMKELQIV